MRSKLATSIPYIMFASGLSFIIASIIAISVYFNTVGSNPEGVFTPTYYHSAKVVDVYDGESLVVNVDLGFDNFIKETSVRLAGVDVEEESISDNRAAVDFLDDRITGKYVVIKTEGQDQNGHWLVKVYRNGVDINNEMIDQGYAEPAYGR